MLDYINNLSLDLYCSSLMISCKKVNFNERCACVSYIKGASVILLGFAIFNYTHHHEDFCFLIHALIVYTFKYNLYSINVI